MSKERVKAQAQAQEQAQMEETAIDVVTAKLATIVNLVDAQTALAADSTLYDGTAQIAFDNGETHYRDLGGKLEAVKVIKTADGKTAVALTDTKTIMEYDRLAFLKGAGKAAGFGICKELAKAEESGNYKRIGGCKTVQEYAHKFFGYSTSTVNFYIRIGKVFIDERIDDAGKSHYSVKPPFDVFDITASHLQELLPLYEKFKADDNYLLSIYDFMNEHEINIENSVATLRKDVKEALESESNIINGAVKEVGESEKTGQSGESGEPNDTGEHTKVDNVGQAKVAIFNHASEISKILELYGNEIFGENITAVRQALVAMLSIE